MTKRPAAWLVQVEEEYGTRHIVAHVVIPQEDGELHNAQRGYGNDHTDYADFRVRCYLGNYTLTSSTTQGKDLWGFTHEYKPYAVESADQAKAMARVFGRVERGLKKAQESAGYVKDNDYHAYLLRVGVALGITTYYVRNAPRQKDMSGEDFRKVNADTLSWWLGDVQELAEKNPSALKGR